MMTKEQFDKTSYNCSYEEHCMCDCSECRESGCRHRDAYRRRPEADGGLGLCPRLKDYYASNRTQATR